MAPASTACLLSLCLGLAVANNLCQNENGTTSDACFHDEAAEFLQRGAVQKSSFLVKKQEPVTTVKPVDCLSTNKPIQMIKDKDDSGYSAKLLNVTDGSYSTMFKVPFKREGWEYGRMNGCAISPVDNIMYCTLQAKPWGNYLVRLDSERIEVVARVPLFNLAGAFSQNGTMFLGSGKGKYIVIQDVHKLKGVYGKERNDGKILDLRGKPPLSPGGFFRSDDCVIIEADLESLGYMGTYVITLAQAELCIARYDFGKEEFVKWWKVGVTPYRWDRFYGAAWSFQNKIFFANNQGKGVYQLPLENLTLKEGFAAGTKLALANIGKSEASMSNDGMNCEHMTNPWVTEAKPFNCKQFPGVMHAVVRETGYVVSYLDHTTKNYTKIYDVASSRTTPPFKALNALGLSPLDNVPYGTLVLDDWDDSIYPTPPPLYVVRFDSKIIEFVAKVQASHGTPIAGTVDGEGNYYFISNPALFKIPRVDLMKGYASQSDPDLPTFTMDSEIVVMKNITGAQQLADIIAIKGNFDGKGESVWVLGFNAYEQLVVIKPEDGSMTIMKTNDVLNGVVDRQNFGAAWYYQGQFLVGSNDGAGVFKVPLDQIKVPDDGTLITLEKVGDAEGAFSNDGFNCIESDSPYAGTRLHGNITEVMEFGKFQDGVAMFQDGSLLFDAKGQ